MKERPILFSGAMVRAILSGSKTQTRRVKGLEKFNGETSGRWQLAGDTFELDGGFEYAEIPVCPYGIPGNRLWVRETFCPNHIDCISGPLPKDRPIHHDGEPCEIFYRANGELEAQCEDADGGRWRPSIHMPRWASRILLEIVSVRVERLNDISNIDAIDEGVMTLDQKAMFPDYAKRFEEWEKVQALGANTAPPRGKLPKERFEKLWESINGKGSWSDNPFVWVVEFKRINPLGEVCEARR